MSATLEIMQDSDCELDDDWPAPRQREAALPRRLGVDCRLPRDDRDHPIQGAVRCPRAGAGVDLGACSRCFYARGVYVEQGVARAEVACAWSGNGRD